MNEIQEVISSATIPTELKNYFIRSKKIESLLSPKIVEEIEDIYLYYDALYVFDISAFEECVVFALNHCRAFDTYSFYLKKILEKKLTTTSKDKKTMIQIEKIFLESLFRELTLEIVDSMLLPSENIENQIPFILGEMKLISMLMKEEEQNQIYKKLVLLYSESL